MTNRVRSAVIIFLSVSFICISLVSPVFCASHSAAKIVEAESALRQAMKNVIEAERAGANVSSLISDLNAAGDVLADAVRVAAAGDDQQAVTLAESSKSWAESVSVQASDLKVLYSSRSVFLSTLAFSGLGVLVFVGLLVAVWVVFKRSHTRRILNMSPKVASDGET